jgi:membrane-bound metal-dependent hydrolase YbcI (DUF457 family)
MFIGHYAVALAGKRLAPEVSLGTLILAGQFADLLWPTLVLLGVETFVIAPPASGVTPLVFTHYPYSHSLLMLLVWGGLFALVYWWLKRGRWVALVTLAALVVSHWFLDLLVHRPDMPLTIAGESKYGMGLWNSMPATLILEFLFLLVGVFIYTRVTVARDRVGTLSFWGLVLFLVVVEVANTFSPPPPSVDAVTWSAQALWLLVLWGYWIDRHRTLRVSN